MRILLTGNIFYEYELSIKNALIELGHEVILHFMNFEGPFLPTKDTAKWLKYGVLPYKLKINYFTKKSKDQYNQQLRDILERDSIDLVIVIKGLTIDTTVFENYSGVRALWILDSIKRFETVQESLKFYDLIYTYEPSDVSFSKRVLKHNIFVLPVAFDPVFYHPIKASQRYRMSFVGGRKPNREEFINEIINEIPLSLVGDFYKSKRAIVRKSVLFKRAGHKYINQLYNESIINLNIHKPQSEEGVNPRFFEILGAGGGVQLVEPKALAKDFIDFEHLVYYESVDECLDKSRYLFKNPKMVLKIAQNGYKHALNNHTWRHRVQTIISDSEKLV